MSEGHVRPPWEAIPPRIIDQEYEVVPASGLIPHPDNAREGDIGLLASLITENSFYGACVVNRRTRHILVGNHRYFAAVEVGMSSIPVFWVDVDDLEEIAILTSDNKASDSATNDLVKMAALLGKMSLAGKLQKTGHDLDDLDQILRDLKGYKSPKPSTPKPEPAARQDFQVEDDALDEDESVLSIPMEVSARSAVLRLLDSAMRERGFDSQADALMDLLGLEV